MNTKEIKNYCLPAQQPYWNTIYLDDFPDEYSLLEDFLYNAIYIPEGMEAPSREIIRQPELAFFVRKEFRHLRECYFQHFLNDLMEDIKIGKVKSVYDEINGNIF